MSAAYVLITMSFLGGSAWGPTISQQEYTSKEACDSARETVMQMQEEMNKTNLAGGRSLRETLQARCVKK